MIKELIEEGAIEKNSDAHGLQNEYQIWLLKHKPFKNNLIILDSGIERKYPAIFEAGRQKNYRIFVIKLYISEDEIVKRIKKREKHKAINYFRELGRWKREFAEFDKKFKCDFTIRNERKTSLGNLFRKLDGLLR